jgi:hypothetical protein
VLLDRFRDALEDITITGVETVGRGVQAGALRRVGDGALYACPGRPQTVFSARRAAGARQPAANMRATATPRRRVIPGSTRA